MHTFVNVGPTQSLFGAKMRRRLPHKLDVIVAGKLSEVGSYEFNRYFKPDRNPVRLTVLRKERIKVPAGEFGTRLNPARESGTRLNPAGVGISGLAAFAAAATAV